MCPTVRGAELVDAVRLMDGDMLERVGCLLGTPPSAIDVLGACLASRRARKKLADFLTAPCTTPRHQMVAEPVQPPPVVRPSRPNAVQRCLTFR